MDTTPNPRTDDSARYEIRFEGRLDARWAARFDGMTLSTGDGISLLEGVVADQSALHGLLHQLRDIGLPLVSLTRAGAAEALPSSEPATPPTGE